ncbi:subclass B3 metallo-beta-lactamase [Qipengyuania sphaerica]|uniref:subclass B3 metallo-beta-lactamase n=1 Tax=Qipengyuania sphaerica TaxID=2867243 RepID=UPI001C870714|nr:subclass B3 metallo-beta-lactamase [Qipengyuania sphaerica]MBX7540504.1 subclass B3 metallo-beta-lactamase [Qipengyuania sphaerica]
MSARIVLPLAFALSACTVATNEAPAPEAPVTSLPAVPDEPFHEACEPWDDWDKPARPFSLMGHTYYVGTCGISAILVTGEEGHVLIDSGISEAVPNILASIRSLGVDPRGIKYILMSHEHFDHVGGHAALKAATGAQVIASAAAKPVLESGLVAADDPQANVDHPPFPGVTVDRIVADGGTLELGNLKFTAHATPGHSPGALSWTWWSCNLPGEPPVCRRMAYADSLSPVSADDYRFSDHPDVVAAFRNSIDKVRFLQCDYLVTPHPSASGLIKRLRDGTYGEPGECQRYADKLTKALDTRLAKEAAR